MKRFLITVALMAALPAFAHADQGKTLYDETCAACHGDQAYGERKLSAPQLAGQDQTYLNEQMINFREGLRGTHADDEHGQSMRLSAVDLSDADIAAVSTYLAGLVPQKHGTSVDGDVKQGAVYYRDNCADCHGMQAQGVSAVYSPNLTILQDWYIEAQTKAYLNNWRGHERSTTRAKGMRSMAAQFDNEQEIRNVIAWLKRGE